MLFGGQTGLGAAADATSVPTAHLTNVWLGRFAVTAAISMVPVSAALTAREVIRDRAVVASVAGPTMHVPPRDIVRAGRHTISAEPGPAQPFGSASVWLPWSHIDKRRVPRVLIRLFPPSSGATFGTELGKTLQGK
jgi:hypothetical protein